MAKKSPVADARNRFVAAYVNGPPALKGDWHAINKALGTSFTMDDLQLRKAIEAEGGSAPLPPDIIMTVTPELLEATAPKQGAYVETAKKVIAERQGDFASSLKEAMTALDEIIKGSKKGSAAQVSAIKEVLKRALDKDEQETALGVVIVPTVGCAENQLVCPRCAVEYAQAAVEAKLLKDYRDGKVQWSPESQQ